MREMKDSGIEWIGEIPVGWEVIKCKYTTNLYTGNSIKDEEKANYEDSTNAVPYIATKDIDVTFSTVDYENGLYVKNDDVTFLRASAGDTLMCIEGGSAGRKKAMLDRTVCFVNKLCCFHPVCIDATFLYYVLNSPHYEEEFKFNISGLIGGVSKTKLLNFIFPFPPLTSQLSLSTYLDTKCEKIDSIIARQQEVIEKLKAYKLSVITEAVTKGLNPDVRMKESGVEWIGDVPEHWDITSVARISTVVRGASPRPAGDPLYFNGSDVPWITVAEVTKDEGKYIYETETFLTFAGAEKSRVVEKGTLLLSNSGATLGVPKITCITGCINDGSLAFYDLKINQTYLLYIFKGRTFELRKQMQGYGQPNLNTSIVKAIQIPLPTDNEQVEICDYLDKKCSAIDSAIAKKQAIIDKLTAYKKSLIYEVVTGKREV